MLKRHGKSKFSEGEVVLCYEPDPAKTKVLYSSKVRIIDFYIEKSVQVYYNIFFSAIRDCVFR